MVCGFVARDFLVSVNDLSNQKNVPELTHSNATLSEGQLDCSKNKCTRGFQKHLEY